VGLAAEPLSKFAIPGIITISATKVVAYLRTLDLFLVVIMFGLSFSGYALAWFDGRLLGVDRSTRVAMAFACGMRNISVGVVIGTGFSPPDLLLSVVVVHALSAGFGFDLGVPVRLPPIQTERLSVMPAAAPSACAR
jgi:predicted Na+-dependent transporter